MLPHTIHKIDTKTLILSFLIKLMKFCADIWPQQLLFDDPNHPIDLSWTKSLAPSNKKQNLPVPVILAKMNLLSVQQQEEIGTSEWLWLTSNIDEVTATRVFVGNRCVKAFSANTCWAICVIMVFHTNENVSGFYKVYRLCLWCSSRVSFTYHSQIIEIEIQ